MLHNLDKQFAKQFAYMSEKERLTFLKTFSDFFHAYLSFCMAYREHSVNLVGKMYNAVLFQKGLVASGMAGLRAKVAASGDKEAFALLEKLAAKKTQRAALSNMPTPNHEQWAQRVKNLDQEINELEREFVKTAGETEQEKTAQVKWTDIQKTLNKDEAAVEFVRLLFPDSSKPTASQLSFYIALVVTPETPTAPKFVLLGEARALEGDPLVAYQQQVDLPMNRARNAQGAEVAKPKLHVPENKFYDAFWKPLEAALQGAKRIFLSPDGVLNQVSFAIVPVADGQLLMDLYDLRIVSSTRDLLGVPATPVANTAVLIGNPDFNLDETKYRAALRSLQQKEAVAQTALPEALKRSLPCYRGQLDPLPGTKTEVEAISSLLAKQGWNVELLTEQSALEEAVKQVRSPRVLHVATHGFFNPAPDTKPWDIQPSGTDDPMLLSGLFFAGANHTLLGKLLAEDLGDGILTAYEATQLNLHGTELVVLSACDTGLGYVAAGEGVFGLRRALQVAGTEAVLMSMWEVPDEETQELMGLFYQSWLRGSDKHASLRKAQMEMRKTIAERDGKDQPWLWGAFVMVGPR